ncbi:WG repeat-containing protein [Xanthocytophaga agilis]|uniref:WG repeat-containing protein n=1 Tax=Xanthocytophaga agilis TaxID=3048010 RepID=A0AAE3UI00_9BACT|nr:WG repeat-containing protein [Xanthocytophaga agilis]MDJ1504841.1 WG repeat-containing protein [Xanthocytophaga agilis]
MKLTYWHDRILLESGYSLVRVNQSWGIVNANDKWVVPALYHSIQPLKNNGGFLVRTTTQTYRAPRQSAVIDLHHNILLPFACRRGICYNRQENTITYYELLTEQNKHSHTLYITSTGITKDIPGSNPYTRFTRDGYIGVINAENEIVLPAEWKTVQFYPTYFCVMDSQDQWFSIPLVAPHQKIPLQVDISYALDKDGLYLRFRQGDFLGIIDNTGHVRIPPLYTYITYEAEHLFIVSIQKQQLLVNLTSVTTSTIYLSVQKLREGEWAGFTSTFTYDVLNQAVQIIRQESLEHLKEMFPDNTQWIHITPETDGYLILRGQSERQSISLWVNQKMEPLFPIRQSVESIYRDVVFFSNGNNKVNWMDATTYEVLSTNVYESYRYSRLIQESAFDVKMLSLSLEAFWDIPSAQPEDTPYFRLDNGFVMALLNKKGHVIQWHWRTFLPAEPHPIVARSFSRDRFRSCFYLYTKPFRSQEKLPYFNIVWANENMLLVKQNQRLHLLDKHLYPLTNNTFKRYKAESHYLLLRNNRKIELWDFDGKLLVHNTHVWQFTLWNADYIIYRAPHCQTGIITIQQEWILPAEYEAICPVNAFYCMVKKNRRWYLYSLTHRDFVLMGDIQKFTLKRESRQKNHTILRVRRMNGAWQVFTVYNTKLTPA